MNKNDIVKFIEKAKSMKLSDGNKILLGCLLLMIGADRCSRHSVDTTEIDRQIATAQAESRIAEERYQESAAKRSMYIQKCDSLTPAFNVRETSSKRARRAAQWRQYRDSVSKYNDLTIDLQNARDAAKYRVEKLVSERQSMKMR